MKNRITDVEPTSVAPTGSNAMLAEVPVKVKLLTLWMMDKEFEPREPDEYMISCGMWETCYVFYKDNHRAYELMCVLPMHKDLKIGDTRRMYEDVILALCHPVQITHLPKIVR
jgi:hypothetical protein